MKNVLLSGMTSVRFPAFWTRRPLAQVIFSASLLYCATACSTLTTSQSTDFTLVRGVPLIKAHVGASPDLLFLIDTGVDPSVIDLNTARQLGLPIDDTEIGEAAGTGDGNGLEIRRAAIEGLSIASQRYPSIEAVAADLSGFSAMLKSELSGILGFSFLNGQTVRIDYRTNEIAFAKTADELPHLNTPISSAYSMPLRYNSANDPIPVFTILVSGEPVIVSLDTGKSAGVEFYEPVSKSLNLRSLVTSQTESNRVGARGMRTITKGFLDSIEIGPYTLNAVPVSFSSVIADGESRQGNAGNAILQNFVVTIDYAKGEIIFAQ